MSNYSKNKDLLENHVQMWKILWILNADRNLCPDDGLDTYSFIGEPPTSKRFDYTQSWKQVESFFVKTITHQ